MKTGDTMPIRGIHTMLHNALDRAVKERLIVRNPADDCVPPKIPKHEMKILPPKRWAISWHRSCKNKRAAERMRRSSSPPLFGHFAVWVTVWVRRF